MLRLWNKLISLDPTRITRVIFEWDHQNLNPDSWSGKMWNVFDLLNLSDTFLNGTEVNILQAKRKLNMIMHQTWCEKLPFKPKLRTYMLIKNSLEPESFVTGFLNKFQRSLITQLRIGILPLAVETGRYYRTPLENRVCQICNDNLVEDEFHFVCKCTAYSDIRLRYFPHFNKLFKIYEMDVYEQFYNIIKTEKYKLLVNYINEIWQTRKSMLYC